MLVHWYTNILFFLLLVIDRVYEALKKLEQVSKVSMDVLECRIERALKSMSSTLLLTLPEDEPILPQDFLTNTETTVNTARNTLKMWVI